MPEGGRRQGPVLSNRSTRQDRRHDHDAEGARHRVGEVLFDVPDQEEVLRKACEHHGVEIVDHIQDDGHSAKTFNRPSFQNFLVRLKSGQIKVDFLYVVRWDRFSRNMENGYLMIHELRSYRAEVKCLEETYDTSDPASVMLRAIKIAGPEMDNRRRAKNTQMGVRRALKEGRYACGAAPVWFDIH